MQKKALINLIQLILSCIVCSIAVNWIAIPNGFAVTGTTGIAMTIEKFTGIHYALISYVITGIVIITTIVIMGFHEVTNILLLSCLYPAVLFVMSYIPIEIVLADKLIAIAAFGVVYGVGAGLAYRIGFSYGGTDTIGKLLKHTVMKSVPLKTVMLLIEVLVLMFMLLAFSFDIVTYAFVGQLIYVNSMNYVVFNVGPKLYEVQIIGDDLEMIDFFVFDEIHKTTTNHKVMGGYSGKVKNQMDLVCTSKEYVRLRDFIKYNNIECFIKVFPIIHVFGQDKDFRNIGEDVLE